VRFSIFFNFQNPAFSEVQMVDRYAAAIEMAEWADNLGAFWIGLPEHHGSSDGILPSPLAVVAAMAARTNTVRFNIAAMVAAFHDPLRLAEDIAVVDQITRGRLDFVIAGGYARKEFDMFGVEMRERPMRITEVVTTLKKAFTGEPFEFRGRIVRITPTPYQPGGPAIVMGGNSEAAARRAARIGDGFMPAQPGFWEFYTDELKRLGKPDPGPPSPGDVSNNVTLAEDPDAAWEQLAPYFLHEMNTQIARYFDGVPGGYTAITDHDALRETGMCRVLTPDQFVEELQVAPDSLVMFNPMCGGIPPELGWESLRLFERDVLPNFS
jgi:alkanesulfonate monooxygenase SsuD/methylene tetrahydromethanopterin reductase-like flavin-dependent oxidoreductase (luciferase family)